MNKSSLYDLYRLLYCFTGAALRGSVVILFRLAKHTGQQFFGILGKI